jgi:glutamate 5-kinase
MTTPALSIKHTLEQAQRLVIKLGSQVIVDHSGLLALDRLAAYVKDMANLHHEGKGVLVVSSGAVALGRQKLKFPPGSALTEDQRQACASVGQALMINLYRECFQHYGVDVAQILVNPSDFSDRLKFNQLNTLLQTLLALRIVPILNENDAIPDIAPELARQNGHRVYSFSDNDRLAAVIATQTGADALLILSNVEGIYTTNPFEDPTATLLRYIPALDALRQVDTTGKTLFGRGGMASKLEAAEMASRSGSAVIIASGLRPQAIASVLRFQKEDSHFPASFIPAQAPETSRYKRWIAQTSGYAGVVVINAGAAEALLHKGASLLAVGVVDALGEFRQGDVVSIQIQTAEDAGHQREDHPLNEIARGIVNFSATELRHVMGHHSDAVLQAFGPRENAGGTAVVHRDRLVILP